jgi:PPE-repeat protein
MRYSLLFAFVLVACSSSDTDPASSDGSGGVAGQSSAGAGGTSGAGASAGSGQAGKGTAGQGTAGSGQAGKGTAGSGTAGSGQAGSGQAGSGMAGSGTAGSGTAGSGTAGQGQAGSAGDGQAGQGQAGQGQAGAPGDPFEPYRQHCVDKINEYRASIGLPPYARWKEGEACADQMADHDADVMSAHDGFGKQICSPRGGGQNECPGYGSPDALDGCLGQMWSEGPTATGEWDVAHGHYMNMVGDYTYMGYHQMFSQVACGFSSKGWFLQNFQ